MNRIFKLLIEQADNYAHNMNPEKDSYGRPANLKKFQQDRDENFAELIVGHAIDCVRDVLRDETSNLNYDAASQVQQKLRNFFGFTK